MEKEKNPKTKYNKKDSGSVFGRGWCDRTAVKNCTYTLKRSKGFIGVVTEKKLQVNVCFNHDMWWYDNESCDSYNTVCTFDISHLLLACHVIVFQKPLPLCFPSCCFLCAFDAFFICWCFLKKKMQWIWPFRATVFYASDLLSEIPFNTLSLCIALAQFWNLLVNYIC